ncbi:MAG: polysaccharide deacetylase family protein [Rubrivivax sp.]|nr:polysaccharide deacetylase family protein [Rubrivivax sp.]
MSRFTKLAIYRTARALGLFRLARFLTRDRLRILAYHGFSDGDAVRFRPKLFISGAAFRRRLETLERIGMPVVTLDAAVAGLRSGKLPGDAVVITVDDGYASTLTVAAPLLAVHRVPATVYVTTYHVDKQTPVFDVCLAYLLWRAPRSPLRLDPSESPSAIWPMQTAADRERALNDLLAQAHAMTSEDARQSLLRQVAEASGIDFDRVLASDEFRLLAATELAALARQGVTVGMHTHRHRFPPRDLECCRQEVARNAARLTEITGQVPRHFCYPSGVYNPEQWALLDEAGVLSSVTCDTGLVRATDPPHGLPRFVDGEMVTDIEFEAEVCGFSPLLRGLLGVHRSGGAA